MASVPRHDCLVIGGGPAGLTAAIYLARFHLSVMVVDAGRSRAASIPLTRNHAGYPGGIAGTELLARMRAQAVSFGAEIVEDQVVALGRDEAGFTAACAGRTIGAAAVLLATGVTNRRPAMPDALHDEALARGLLRYCPICDGFEVTDRAVAVIGTGERGFNEAIFLRGFTRDLTLIAPDGAHDLDAGQRARLDEAAIILCAGPPGGFTLHDQEIEIALPGGSRRFFCLYPALGSEIHSDLGRMLGAECSDEGCLLVDTHQRTSLAGLYAAGDVVAGLDQISHAMGEGGVASTTMRNDLAARGRLWR